LRSPPRLTELAFDEVLQVAPDRGRLLTITLLVLGVVLVQGLIDLGASLSIEVLAQHLERDTHDELCNTYFRLQSLDYRI